MNLSNNYISFVIFMLVIISIGIGIVNLVKLDRLDKRVETNSAITNFAINQITDNDPPFDYVDATGDTLVFYKDNEIVGKTLYFTKVSQDRP